MEVIHAHPTLSEAFTEAVRDFSGQSIHLPVVRQPQPYPDGISPDEDGWNEDDESEAGIKLDELSGANIDDLPSNDSPPECKWCNDTGCDMCDDDPGKSDYDNDM